MSTEIKVRSFKEDEDSASDGGERLEKSSRPTKKRSSRQSEKRKDSGAEDNPRRRRRGTDNDDVERERQRRRREKGSDDEEKPRRRRRRDDDGDVEMEKSSQGGRKRNRSASDERQNPIQRVSRTEAQEERSRKKRRERVTIPEKSDKSEAGGRKDKFAAAFNKTRAGGIYIPPGKLRAMMKDTEQKDPESKEFQRQHWEALRKTLNGMINKVNKDNITEIAVELLHENIVLGKGLLCRGIMKAQMAAPTYTNVYAALISVVNSKFPEIGELLLKRLVMQFQRAFKRNDKIVLKAVVTFFAHLVNVYVEHEIGALELITLLLEEPTNDSVEVAVEFTKECGARLEEVTPKGMIAIFERFRELLQNSQIAVDGRVQHIIEDLMVVRKDNFKDHPSILPELDIVEEDDIITHEIHLNEDHDQEQMLNVFQFNENFKNDIEDYKELVKEMLGSDSEEEDEDGEEGDEEGEEEDDEEEEEKQKIIDQTGAQERNLRRVIYLIIMSSLTFEEAAHKLLGLDISEGDEKILAAMVVDCCSQERTYLKYYGCLGERFCRISPQYRDAFDDLFGQQYLIVHKYETNKLRNVAKFFSHLLFTDALDWGVLEYIRLTEQDTTSSSRIFIKILFQELAEYMTLLDLKKRIDDPSLAEALGGLFPKDNPKNTRFSINFFTSIGLGGLTVSLRKWFHEQEKLFKRGAVSAAQFTGDTDDSSDDSDSSDSDSSDSDSSDSDSSDSGSSESGSSDSDDSDSSDSGGSEDSSSSDESSGGRSPDPRSRRSRKDREKSDRTRKDTRRRESRAKEESRNNKPKIKEEEVDESRTKSKSDKSKSDNRRSGQERSDRGRSNKERNHRERNDRERNDRERNDRDRDDRDRSDRDRGGDRDRGDRDRGDRERSNRNRSDRERGDRENSIRKRSGRERGRDERKKRERGDNERGERRPSDKEKVDKQRERSRGANDRRGDRNRRDDRRGDRNDRGDVRERQREKDINERKKGKHNGNVVKEEIDQNSRSRSSSADFSA